MAKNPNLEISKDVIDLDLSVTRKRQFRFNKDDDRLIELNIADMSIIKRLSETYPKLQEWLTEMQDISNQETNSVFDDMESIGNALSKIDANMRDAIDYIFNAPVSKAAAPDGTMYDIFEGQFRFEYILELLLGYYENNMSDEFKKMQKHVKKYTNKG